MDDRYPDYGDEERPGDEFGECQGCKADGRELIKTLVPGGGEAFLCRECSDEAYAKRCAA